MVVFRFLKAAPWSRVETRERINFSNHEKCLILETVRKEGDQMADEEKLSVLEEENRRLREDNDKLMEIVVQMRATLNRLVLRYVSEDG